MMLEHKAVSLPVQLNNRSTLRAPTFDLSA